MDIRRYFFFLLLLSVEFAYLCFHLDDDKKKNQTATNEKKIVTKLDAKWFGNDIDVRVNEWFWVAIGNSLLSGVFSFNICTAFA